MTDSALWLFLVGTATLAAPLVLAAIGGLLSERSGVINIGLEGCMLSSACATAIVGATTGNAYAGLAAGLCAALAMSLLHFLLTQVYSLDHIVSGMAVNALAIGGTNFVAKSMADAASTKAATFNVQAFWVLALLLTAAVALTVRRTRWGLSLRAVGEDPDKSREKGVAVAKVRLAALVGTGILTGLSGAVILSNAQSFSDGMTGGRGFIALAALIIGGWRVWPTLVACVLFGAVSALQFHLQGTQVAGAEIPSEVWNALPYLATVVALAGLIGRSGVPSGLGKP